MTAGLVLLLDLPQASTFAASVDRALVLAAWFAVFCAVLVAGAFALAVLAPRAPDDEPRSRDPRPLLRVAGTLAAAFLFVVFLHGAYVWADVRTTPRGALPIQVEVAEGAFRFTYPGGHQDAELHLPLDRPVRFAFAPQDQPYTFAIPEFRLQASVAVARPAEAWVEAIAAGEYVARSTREPGASIQPATVVVHAAGGYETWHQGVSGPPLDLPPIDLGRRSYEMRGCAQCHALDGTRGIGPGFGGFSRRAHEMQDGTRVEPTEEYVRESVLDPQAKVVAGFEPVMPSFRGRLHDLEVAGLAAFLRSLE